LRMAVWRLPKTDPNLPLLEQVRVSRGVVLEDAAKADPFSIPGMEEVVSRVLSAVSAGSRVAVFGDYDCDGICGTAVLVEALRTFGIEPLVRLPRREEGYGIQPEQVRELAGQGAEMIITVDNGITALEAVEAAKELGVSIVVTDHHEPKDRLPDCPAANPKLNGSGYRDYCGASVAYLLACALSRAVGRPEPEHLLELVSLATVADVCPVTGPNYHMSRRGLLQMRSDPRPGIKQLAEVSGTRRIDGSSLGWQIVPRINVAGRMGDPACAYDLLTAESTGTAAGIAEHLNRLNRERQELVKAAFEECLEKYDGSYFPVFVIGYHHGIAGIAAGRVAEAVKRPVIVGSNSGGVVTASGRSVGKFNLLGALDECQRRTGLLERYGGHRQAAGLSFAARDLEKIQAALDQIARAGLTLEDITEWVELDGVIKRPLSLDEVRELDILEPCGFENQTPVFALAGPARVLREGEGWKKLSVYNLSFFVPSGLPVADGQMIHAAVTPYIDAYQGTERIAAKAVDVRTHSVTRDVLARAYAAWRQGRRVSEREEKIFGELGLRRNGQNPFVELLKSETFRRYGVL